MITKNNVILCIMGILLLIATSSALYHWYKKPSVITQTEYVTVPQIKTVEKIKRIEVPIEKIVTIEKTVVVDKLSLPDWVKTDENKHIIATALIPPHKGNTNAVALIDTTTGKGEIIAKKEPLSLFQLLNEKEVGVRAGYSSGGNFESTLYGQWNFLRVGSVHLGFYGESNLGVGQTSTVNAKVQLQFGYRF